MLLVVAGMVGSSVYGTKQSFTLSPGQSETFNGQTLKFVELSETRHANYTAVGANVTFTAVDGTVTNLRPQRRFYDKSEQPNSEVALSSSWKRDVYLTLAGWEDGGAKAAIEVIVNPLVCWIWVGGAVMAVGGVVAMLPRLLPHASPAPVTQPTRSRKQKQRLAPAATH
jgi:cytochrome c-type biogenesis protein CcmF